MNPPALQAPEIPLPPPDVRRNPTAEVRPLAVMGRGLRRGSRLAARLGLALAGCWSGWAGADAAMLRVADSAAVIGVTKLVSIGLVVSPGPGERIAAVQADIEFDPLQLAPTGVVVGQQAGQAGKQVGYFRIDSRRLRIVVYGINQTVITQGELAIVNFQLAATACPGLTALQAENPCLSSPEGGAVAAQALPGVMAISLPAAAASLDRVRAYPNPFHPGQGQNRLIFYPLTIGAQIRIHQMTGERVAEIDAPLGGLAAWDGKNRNGRDVASGIYLYVITSPEGEKKTGKVVVVR